MNNHPSSVTAQPERRAGHASRRKKLQKEKRRARALADSTSKNLTNTSVPVSTPKPVKVKAASEFSGWFIGPMQAGKFSPYRKFRMESGSINGGLSGTLVPVYAKSKESAQIMRDATERERVILTDANPATGNKNYLSTGNNFSIRVGEPTERQLRTGVNTSSGGRYAHDWGYIK
ncbi:hypothetical protein HRN53_001342 [Salmonella enterica]|nr:hypothetical protein [Salmonella enterica]